MDFDIRFKAVSSKRVRLHYHLYTGSFTLTHPKWLSKMKINEYVIAWEGWMLNCLREQPPPIFKEGCAVTLFGRERIVRFAHPEAKKRRVELSEGSVLLYGNFSEGERDVKEQVETLLEHELYVRARRWMRHFGDRMQLPDAGLFIRSMRSRWGSCFPGKKKIHLSRYLMYKDEKFLQEVVLHEMLHFLYPNHQKGFKEALKRYKM
ncbi:MAG: M48 family metallopeptidase [Tissierellia bacterium]|nr:DUF45 domain-containing protein [Bacillota bacterium]NLL22438.1 M48 family metallopeptidase [Tissierellia bacterium]